MCLRRNKKQETLLLVADSQIAAYIAASFEYLIKGADSLSPVIHHQTVEVGDEGYEYITSIEGYAKGSYVLVPFGKKNAVSVGKVISHVNRHMAFDFEYDFDYPPQFLKRIIMPLDDNYQLKL